MRKKHKPTVSTMGSLSPWQALAFAVIVQAATDYRSVRRMLRKLKRRQKSGKELSQKECDYLTERIDFYQSQLSDIRQFFRSDLFSVYSDADGSELLHRLESEFL